MKLYGNSATKVVHNGTRKDACRASEIKKSNRVGFSTRKEAQAEGYRLCKICFKDPDNEF